MNGLLLSKCIEIVGILDILLSQRIKSGEPVSNTLKTTQNLFSAHQDCRPKGRSVGETQACQRFKSPSTADQGGQKHSRAIIHEQQVCTSFAALESTK
jgi:hypothetical protein